MLPNECIIIGGGNSINSGIAIGLKDKINEKFVVCVNYSYQHFKHTFMIFADRDFYYPNQNCLEQKCHPFIYEELKTLPMIVGINHNGVDEFKLNNTILLDKKYKHQIALTGVLALKIVTELLDFNGNIYLLGFDWDRRKGLPERDPNYNPRSNEDIHYYGKTIQHRGIGLFGYYENHNPDKIFSSFINKPNVRIYNVSPNSNINCFQKINYSQMFTRLNNNVYSQNELREEIRRKLCYIK